MSFLTFISIGFGLASAGAWLYASCVKVSREEALSRRRRAADKSGNAPDLSGVTFDGWEVRETFAAQSRWNSIAAVLSAASIFSQAVAQAIAHT